MASDGVYLGLDIGGTKIGMCVGTPDGKVIASDRIAVDHDLDPQDLLAECKVRLDCLVAEHAAGRQVLALGAACPGPLDYIEGKFLNPPNNPRWHGFALRDWLKSNFPAFPTAMMNDANAAAYAEWLWGAARNTKTAVFLTFSTGMGCGLIIDGRLYEGPLGLAGEIGRIKLSPQDDGPVGFGRRGSVEGYCSGPGMVQMAIAEAIACTQTGEPSALKVLYQQQGTIATEQLCELSRRNDASARRVTDRTALELGRLMAIMTDILNPQVFVLGTIGTAYPELFIPIAAGVVADTAISESAGIVTIRPSALTHRGDQQALAVAAYTCAAGAGKPG